MPIYYNEHDVYAAQWLRNLITEGHIAPGEVDERSIVDVRPADLAGFTQCHFFAGIGGWSYAARLAGWSDNRPLWTGSCPCQPFSVAGKGEGEADARHLWPELFRLVAACRPAVLMGEQVAAAVGKSWLDGVCADLEGVGYACGAAVVPACAVDAPHRRDRLWFVADADASVRCGLSEGQDGLRLAERSQARAPGQRDASNSSPIAVANAQRWGQPQQPQRHGEPHAGERPSPRGMDAERPCVLDRAVGDTKGIGSGAGLCEDRPVNHRACPSGASAWLSGADGKARRVPQSDIRLLAHGVPARVGRLRAYGNAIVPQVAAEVIAAYAEARAA